MDEGEVRIGVLGDVPVAEFAFMEKTVEIHSLDFEIILRRLARVALGRHLTDGEIRSFRRILDVECRFQGPLSGRAA